MSETRTKADKTSAATPAVMDMNSNELHCMGFLAGLDSQLHEHDKHMEARLKSIPGGWRDYRLAMKMVEKVVDAVYATMPEKVKRRMMLLCENGEVVIRPRPVATSHAYVQIVDNDDVKVISNRAIEGDCAICMKRDGAVRSCPLRRALLNVVPPSEIANDGTCPYQHVATNNALGKYIEF